MKRPDADVRTIREAAQISQSQFAKLIGVKPMIERLRSTRTTHSH